mmetsp:Transcript_126486/g.282749  ORF Transcript_126486/g.282749 Transcript_126486/m.282749 type:complete len:205 (-) Transcript_126486:125-739(-)
MYNAPAARVSTGAHGAYPPPGRSAHRSLSAGARDHHDRRPTQRLGQYHKRVDLSTLVISRLDDDTRTLSDCPNSVNDLQMTFVHAACENKGARPAQRNRRRIHFHAALVNKLAQHSEDRVRQIIVQLIDWLVEDHDLRIVDERPRQVQSLLLAIAQAVLPRTAAIFRLVILLLILLSAVLVGAEVSSLSLIEFAHILVKLIAKP